MSEFDKVIGYAAIKQELMQISDMLKNRSNYEALGAKIPHGILIHGKPGYGKTLLAECFIKESRLKTYTLRKTKRDFAGEISKAFAEATANAPAIIFLDDMDKYSDTDRHQCNAEEYVTIQSEMDKCRDQDVLVIATANKLYYLPDSLLRDGRFDRKYKLCPPNEEDSKLIIAHYLEDKNLAADINMDDVLKLFAKKSCAEIECILNDAAIRAVFNRHDVIVIDDIKEAFLREYFESPDFYVEEDESIRKRIAAHEAGHLIVAEILNPGSVSIATICDKRVGEKGGFVCQYKKNSLPADDIIIGLAGKVGEECCCSDTHYSEWSSSDLSKAYEKFETMIRDDAYCGLQGFYYDTRNHSPYEIAPESYRTELDKKIKSEMAYCAACARKILEDNRTLMSEFIAELQSKQTLLASDIEQVFKRCHEDVVMWRREDEFSKKDETRRISWDGSDVRNERTLRRSVLEELLGDDGRKEA